MTENQPARVPTAGQIGCAVGLTSMHTKHEYRDECAWCFRLWRCPDRVWADNILRLAHEAPRGE